MANRLKLQFTLTAAVLMMASGGASALSLVEAYEKARLHDPVYRAAFYAK